MTNEKKLKVTFLPGSFDNFEGTQEELDAIVAEITRLAESGELLENAEEIDLDEAVMWLDDDDAEEIIKHYNGLDVPPRKLN